MDGFPIHLGWPEIAIRLAFATAAGAIIGFNRTEHGRPAEIRTTMHVCLAAAVAMIEANLLLATAGKSADSFARMDILRLPLGILSGIGFLGGGVILKRGDIVLGVTTAATMWFVTVLGLCFGGGQLGAGDQRSRFEPGGPLGPEAAGALSAARPQRHAFHRR